MRGETERALLRQVRRYPLLTAQDCVKLLYQSEFGPGHMAAPEAETLALLREELGLVRTPPVRLVERIGGGLVRFHLDRDRLSPEDLPLVAACFRLTAAEGGGTMAGLWEKIGVLQGLVQRQALPLTTAALAEFLTDYAQRGCPALHHSEVYAALYQPHYRVMDLDLALYFPVFRAIRAALDGGDGPVLVAVDGRCAAGKTTFAARCAQVFPCNVFHMDDFFLPPEKRTGERLSQPGGNVDWERCAEQVFEPVSRGGAASVRRYDCASGTLGAAVDYPPRRLNLVEGSYSLHPQLARYSAVKVFLTCSSKAQRARLERRETPESLKQFKKRWIPLEERYFKGCGLPDAGCLTVDTGKL